MIDRDRATQTTGPAGSCFLLSTALHSETAQRQELWVSVTVSALSHRKPSATT